MGFTLETGVSAAAVFFRASSASFPPACCPWCRCTSAIWPAAPPWWTRTASAAIPGQRSCSTLSSLWLGISFAFFLLGLGLTALGTLLPRLPACWFARASGVHHPAVRPVPAGTGQADHACWSSEHRLPFRLDKLAMNPAVALVMGFTFSFAWTPCVGPTLSSVLLMASSAGPPPPRDSC